jgi:hypothetical protein
MRLLLSAMLLSLMPGICAAQAFSPSEQSLQAILNELRSIHADMRAETARSQSMQLLLAELQIESETLARAVQRVDAARSEASKVQEGVRRAAADLTKAEEAQSAATTEGDITRAANESSRLKAGLASMKRLEQDQLSGQQEAEAALRKAQEAYDGIEDQLAALVKTLRSSQSSENR